MKTRTATKVKSPARHAKIEANGAHSVWATPPERIMNNPYWIRQFTVNEYHQMIESGVFAANGRVELLEGWIVNKMPQNPPHSNSVTRIVEYIVPIRPVGWTIKVQSPITLSDSEPEPDIVLARGHRDIYDHKHPTAKDIGVLMEVGDSSLLDDRRYKGELYAKGKIAEFWLIDLVERKLEVHTKPRGGEYKKKVVYAESETVPLILDGVKIANIPVTELMAKS